MLSGVVTLGDDGYTGSQWRYSNRFAATVPATPRSSISTDWTWSSTQNRALVTNLAGYTPCYTENVNAPNVAGAEDPVRTGSWVQPFTYSMSPAPAATAPAACRRPRR